jgi:hypothetical protein
MLISIDYVGLFYQHIEKWFCDMSPNETTCVVPAFELGSVKAIYERLTRIQAFFREILDGGEREKESDLVAEREKPRKDEGKKRREIFDHFSLLRRIDGPASVFYEDVFEQHTADSTAHVVSPRAKLTKLEKKPMPPKDDSTTTKSSTTSKFSSSSTTTLASSAGFGVSYISPDTRFNRLKTNYRSTQEKCNVPNQAHSNLTESKVITTQQSQFNSTQRLARSIAPKLTSSDPTGGVLSVAGGSSLFPRNSNKIKIASSNSKKSATPALSSKTAAFRRACAEDTFWSPKNAREQELEVVHGWWQDLAVNRQEILRTGDFSQLERLNRFIIEELLCSLASQQKQQQQLIVKQQQQQTIPIQSSDLHKETIPIRSSIGGNEEKILRVSSQEMSGLSFHQLDERLIQFLVKLKPPGGSLRRLQLHSLYMNNGHLRSILDNNPELALLQLSRCWGLGGNIGISVDGMSYFVIL